MKRNFFKRAGALALAGAMMLSSVPAMSITAVAGAGDVPITVPELQVEMPSAGNTLAQAVAANNGLSVSFNPTDDITPKAIRNMTFESDGNHNAFNGVYNFTSDADRFNMSGGRYPMKLQFDIKLSENVGNSDAYNILGKMNNDYGVQVKRQADGDYVQVYTSAGSWATSRVKVGDRGTLNNWTSVVILHDGYKFWISTDGGKNFSNSKLQGSDEFALPNTEAQKFTIGYNYSDGTGTAIGTEILLSDVKMYRSGTAASAAKNVADVPALAASLESETLVLDVSVDNLYTVATNWYRGSIAEDTLTTSYVDDGTDYIMQTVLTATKGHFFTEDSKPAEIQIGDVSVPVEAGITENGKKMVITYTYTGDPLYSIACAYVDGCNKMMGDISVSSPSVKQGETVVFTATPNENIFQGWYRDAAGTDLYSADEVTEYTNEGEDVTLYAKFKQIVFKETAYWDYEKEKGTLAQQTADDIWHYQIQTADGWTDISENVFYPDMSSGSGAWLGNGNATDYHWAKIEKDTLTPCFNGNATYKGVAYAWKASEAGYVKMILAKNMNTNHDKAAMTVTIAKGTDSADQEILKEVAIASGSQNIDKDQFTSKIAKVDVGDYIRFSVATADNDLYNTEPIIVKVTVSEYAAQYLAEVESMEKTSYTNASVQECTTAAGILRTALEASEEDAFIEIKLAALETAVAGLAVKANYDAVNTAVDDANAKIQSGSYTPASVAALQTVLDTVASQMDLDEAHQTEVDAMAAAINAAIADLVQKANTDEMTAAITAAEAKKAEDGYENYTDESKALLEEKLQAAKDVLDNRNATQDAVDTAKTELVDAVAGLTLKNADYTAVTNALTTAGAVTRDSYTPASLAVLDAAVIAAEESLENKLDITQQETVNRLAAAITDAISKLVTKANTDELEAAITAAEAKKAEDGYANYTDESKTALDSKLQAARDALADANATQAAVDAAKTDLNDAVTGMVLKDADYTAVTNALTAAEAVERDLYTADSLAVLDAAVIAVVEGMDITQQNEVDKMAENIKDAIAALERHYTVTVVGGTIKEDRKYKYGEMASVTANDPEEGMKFGYWKVNGQYMCDSSTYNFYVTNDMQVEAHYVKVEETVEQQISMTCVSSYNASTRKITFTARRSLPEGYQVLEHGIIITDSTGYNNFKDNVDGAFVVEANRIKTAKGKTTGVLGNYSAKLSCSRNETWYGRGYVKYKAPDGTVDYAYSPVTSCLATVE